LVVRGKGLPPTKLIPAVPVTKGGIANTPAPALLKVPVAVPVPEMSACVALIPLIPEAPLATFETPEPSPPAEPNWFAATA
jgi:hypothetical protein